VALGLRRLHLTALRCELISPPCEIGVHSGCRPDGAAAGSRRQLIEDPWRREQLSQGRAMSSIEKIVAAHDAPPGVIYQDNNVTVVAYPARINRNPQIDAGAPIPRKSNCRNSAHFHSGSDASGYFTED
jgi:hypothetical protein